MTSKFVEIVPLSHRRRNCILLQPSDGQILEIGPRLEGHSVTFPGTQTQLQGRKVRLYFRGDADEGFLYAIRLAKNQMLQESIGHLLTRPVGRPPKGVAA